MGESIHFFLLKTVRLLVRKLIAALISAELDYVNIMEESAKRCKLIDDCEDQTVFSKII